MRYMYLISGVETGAAPPQRMIDEIDKLAEQEMAAGRMIARGGLLPTAMGSARVESRRGKLKLTDGPFAETKEVIGGFAIFEFATREEAIASAERFMELHRLYWPEWEGVCEMRPMFGFDGACGVGEAQAKLAQPA
ncbi:MAG: YciI family protein [Hyphomonadaceae bacterium]